MSNDLMQTVRELRALEQEATAAPWNKPYKGNTGTWDVCVGRVGDRDWIASATIFEEDAALIVAARNALPALLDAVERLSAENAELREAIKGGKYIADIAGWTIRELSAQQPAVAREKQCVECKKALTPKEAYYYGNGCEACEREALQADERERQERRCECERAGLASPPRLMARLFVTMPGKWLVEHAEAWGERKTYEMPAIRYCPWCGGRLPE